MALAFLKAAGISGYDLLESVSRMLGHTNIKTTQIYARITGSKIANDMDILAGKIGGKHTAPQEPPAQIPVDHTHDYS